MPSFELDFDVQKCTNLYIFNKTRIAGKRLRRTSYKLAQWFIISASTYIPKYSSRKVSQPWKISNTSKYFTKMLHFHLQSSLLFENGYEKFPITWHSGTSLLHRPTFQRTAPGSFSNHVKHRIQINVLAIFCPECIHDCGFANNPKTGP